MCGIAGFSLGPNEQVNAKKLAKALLLDIESRGHDATGFAFVDSTGAFQVHKTNVDATEFVKRRLCIPKRARTAIFHTRFATQGAPEFNENNHPIATGDIVGVHNGMISNDHYLFKAVEEVVGFNVQIGEVDSEAVFAALGWTGEETTKVLEMVRGSATLAWFDADETNRETLNLACVSQNPLWVAETVGGSVIFASTRTAINDACAATGMAVKMLRDINEGVYLKVLHGDIHTVKTFEAPPSYYSFRGAKTTRFHSVYDWDEFDYDTPPHRPVTTLHTVMGGATKLDRRLAAEVPETWDTERYDQWLRENATELDNAISDVADSASSVRFDAFVKQPWLHGGYLTDTGLAVPTYADDVEYLREEKHLLRETAIEEYCRGIQTSTEDLKTKVALSLKGGARPGDSVMVKVCGQSVMGNIVTLPTSFPEGNYFIRAFVPRDDGRGTEAIFITRKHYEFKFNFTKPEPTTAELVRMDR